MLAVSTWLTFVLAVGAGSLVVALLFMRSVSRRDAGGAAARRVAEAVRDGARAFLRRQYRAVALLGLVVAVPLFGLSHLRDGRGAGHVALSFLIGAACSAAAGWWAMFVSLRANVRVAEAARSSTERAFTLALRGGAAAALPVAGGALLGVGALFAAFGGMHATETVPYRIVGFAFGASFVALFAQLGGGIFTKAADIGADLVGKVEEGIPEDDPRNPAVIADLVGDNVGDCAGRGADIFESAAAENIGAMILGAALYPMFGVAGVLFPLVVYAFGLIASVAGVLLARMRRGEEDPMSALTRGHVATMLLASAGVVVATRSLLGDSGWLLAAGIIGIAASFAFAAIARYYTGTRHRPVRGIARSSIPGPVTNVVSGLAVALQSTALPIVTITAALFTSYVCGLRALPDVHGAGVYGTAIATAGMLSTVGYVLSMDMFGPITDNAGGIVEMSGAPAEVRGRTDRLDAAGNTTKAATKGYAIGSAALAAFLLFSAYLEEVSSGAHPLHGVDMGKVPVFLAALAGATVVFAFGGLAIQGVVRGGYVVVEEVRRQFRERAGLLEGEAEPDYTRCVEIITKSALRGMVAPGLLAALAPVVVGALFTLLARADPTFRAEEAVAAMLMAATLTGILLASTMNTGGAAWDNAKKLIETGELGGPGSAAHKAAVVGDGVGDPLKDTAGPSLHVLIKLLGTVALVTAPLFRSTP